MNAGGVLNTCKSSGACRAEVFGRKHGRASGGRVSNAWATCLTQGDNREKFLLIPHMRAGAHASVRKAETV